MVHQDGSLHRVLVVVGGSDELQAVARELRGLRDTVQVVQVQYLHSPDMPKSVVTVKLLDDHNKCANEVCQMLDKVEGFLRHSPRMRAGNAVGNGE